MSRRVAIIQSSYIPWRGYFAIIARCDAFIFLDSVQFTRRDWRTRNRIKTPNGPLWLSIPVNQKGNYHAPIDAITVADFGLDAPAPAQHRNELSTSAALRHAVSCAAGRLTLCWALDFAGRDQPGLIRQRCAACSESPRRCCGTWICSSGEKLAALDPTARLLELAAATDATVYLSGPAARSYLDEAAFAAHGISVAWMDYGGLPEYPQLGVASTHRYRWWMLC